MFPRPTQVKQLAARDLALDGLRGVAVLLVFLFHYGGGLHSAHPLSRFVGYLTEFGWTGVDLFFALSGFLITCQLAEILFGVPTKAEGDRNPRRLGGFYARRALRILPLYLLALGIAAVAALHNGATGLALRPLLVYLAFLQNFPSLLPLALRTPPPVPLHHLWSLAVEEQFYLLWPAALLLTRTRRRALWLCFAVFASSCLFRIAILTAPVMTLSQALSWSTLLPSRAGALALGAALALWPRDTLRAPVRHSWWVLWLALAGVAAVGLNAGTLLLNNRLAFTLALPLVDVASVAVVALSLQSSALRRILVQAGLLFLGRISYGFYVFQLLLQPLVDDLAVRAVSVHAGFAYQLARLLIAFPLTLVVSWGSFRFWETPFLQLKRHFPEPPPIQPLIPAAGPGQPAPASDR